jgi:hypothetical protein
MPDGGDLKGFWISKTVHAIYRWYEAQEANELPRPHLGASIIGEKCERKLWYAFHWIVKGDTPGKKAFDGRMLRLFDTGHRAEHRFCDEFRGIGCIVHAVDPNTGKQFVFADVGGHFGGSMDAAILGLPDAPKTWHVGEFKTHNDASFKKLDAQGVEESKPLHFAQMQCYMGWSGMQRSFYLAENKNDSRLFGDRFEFDQTVFEQSRAKARRVIIAIQPTDVPRITERPDWYECKFCDSAEYCHGLRVPTPTCRTCCHATPVVNDSTAGQWTCGLTGNDITDVRQQVAGCAEHLTLPGLIKFAEPVDHGPSFVIYKRKDNGSVFANVGATGMPPVEWLESHGCQIYTSKELAAVKDTAAIGEKVIGDIKGAFPGAVVRS